MPQNSSSKPLIVALDNVRSAHNVGAIMRTAEALGARELWCLGITPYPKPLFGATDERLPHVAERAHKAIAKTALGAELTLPTRHFTKLADALMSQATKPYIYAFEQTAKSIPLSQWQPAYPAVLVFGHEREGVSPEILKVASQVVEIPLTGQKESLNVSAAAAIALYCAQAHTL